MKIIILALVCFSLCSYGFSSSLKYNPMENKWEYAEDDEQLKYNPMENEWTYEKDDTDLKYNPMDNEWTYEEE